MKGKNLEIAYPSMPVEILGMQECKAGDEFFVVENEEEVKK